MFKTRSHRRSGNQRHNYGTFHVAGERRRKEHHTEKNYGNLNYYDYDYGQYGGNLPVSGQSTTIRQGVSYVMLIMTIVAIGVLLFFV